MMPRAKQITATALAVVMLTATAWCICTPTVSIARSTEAAAPCCQTPGHTTDVPHRPAQDCPSCSWSVLRSAGDLRIAPHDRSTDARARLRRGSRFRAGACVRRQFSAAATPALPPPERTLFDLHCQLLDVIRSARCLPCTVSAVASNHHFSIFQESSC